MWTIKLIDDYVAFTECFFEEKHEQENMFMWIFHLFLVYLDAHQPLSDSDEMCYFTYEEETTDELSREHMFFTGKEFSFFESSTLSNGLYPGRGGIWVQFYVSGVSGFKSEQSQITSIAVPLWITMTSLYTYICKSDICGELVYLN